MLAHSVRPRRYFTCRSPKADEIEEGGRHDGRTRDPSIRSQQPATGARQLGYIDGIRRLGPGYAAALLGSLALILLVPSMRHLSGDSWDVSLPALSVGAIVTHLLLVDNWRLGWRYTIDTPMWTVALEVQIYVIFVVALLRSGGAPSVVGRTSSSSSPARSSRAS